MGADVNVLPQRFWDKVVLSSAKVSETLGFCWLWTGAHNTTGYGTYQEKAFSRMAHRRAYEVYRGSITADLELDHLCSVRDCIRPLHLEAVTRSVNNKRAARGHDACRRGHPLVEGNLRYSTRYGSTVRCCRICENAARRARRAAGRAN